MNYYPTELVFGEFQYLNLTDKKNTGGSRSLKLIKVIKICILLKFFFSIQFGRWYRLLCEQSNCYQ